MKALILAAGYATRLYPLTKEKPKPLLVVGKKPIIEHLIQKLDDLDELDAIYIVTNQKFYNVFEDWLKGLKSKKQIVLVNDGTTKYEDRLGALGDIELALRWQRICDDLLILAGDNIFDCDLKGFVEYAKACPQTFAMGVYDIKDKKKASKYGVVEIDDKSCLRNLKEKPTEPVSSLVAMGIYYFPKERLNLVSEYLKVGKEKDAPGHFVHWLLKSQEVRGYIFKGIWYDIGDKVSYRQANHKFPT
ncbi:MAG: nucleotidyltransferase family protein [Candidatus Omnitrophota bacterium]